MKHVHHIPLIKWRPPAGVRSCTRTLLLLLPVGRLPWLVRPLICRMVILLLLLLLPRVIAATWTKECISRVCIAEREGLVCW